MTDADRLEVREEVLTLDHLKRNNLNFSEFNYTLKWVDDGAYGSNDTGEWNGMLGEIIENVREFVLKNHQLCCHL